MQTDENKFETLRKGINDFLDAEPSVSMSAFARVAGISAPYLSQFLRGERAEISENMYQGLQQTLEHARTDGAKWLLEADKLAREDSDLPDVIRIVQDQVKGKDIDSAPFLEAYQRIMEEAASKAMENFKALTFGPIDAKKLQSLRMAAFQAGLKPPTPEARPVPVAQPPVDIVIPHYTQRVHAGSGAVAWEASLEEFNVTQHYRNTTSYEVSGDSMVDAGIDEGDRIIVRNGYAFRNGDVILCRYNGELMVKGARIVDGKIWLYPANPKYHPWQLKEDDQFECIGTVIDIIKKPRTDWWKDVQ